LKAIKENFGDYPVISVDFPWSEEEEDDDYIAQHNQKKRAQSLRILLDKLLIPKYKSVRLEILSSFQFYLLSFIDSIKAIFS
jgi:hypothetical protein